MENQMNVGNQNSQQVGQNSVNQPLTAPENPKTNYLMIGGVILACFVVFGFGGYYLGKQYSTPQSSTDNPSNQLIPTTAPESETPTSTPTNQQVGSPSGWSYKNNGECGAKFAIPPKQAPYYYPIDPNRTSSVTDEQGSGRFWDFPRGAAYPNLLSKVLLPNQEYKQAITMFANPEEASGYISQAVAVSCIPNNERFADNNAFISSLTAELDKYNKSTGEKGMQASSYAIKSNTSTTKWGKSVADLTVSEYFENSGGQPFTNSVAYTMFVTSQYVYEVKVFGATSDTSVKETAEKIFNNLVF